MYGGHCAGFILNFLSTRELMLQKHNINCSPFSLHIGYSLDITPLLHPALAMAYTQGDLQSAAPMKYFLGHPKYFSIVLSIWPAPCHSQIV